MKNRQPESKYILLLWQYYTAWISSSKNICKVNTELALKPTDSDPVRITALERKSRSKSTLKQEMILRFFDKINSFFWSHLKRTLCLPKYWLFVLSPPEFSSEEEHWLLSTQPILQTLLGNKRFWRTGKRKKVSLWRTHAHFNVIPFLSIHH